MAAMKCLQAPELSTSVQMLVLLFDGHMLSSAKNLEAFLSCDLFPFICAWSQLFLVQGRDSFNLPPRN